MASSPSAGKLLIASGLGMLFDSMDVGILGFVIAALFAAWHISPQAAGELGSLTLVGMAAGSALAGLFADRVGRKKTFIVTLALYSVASGLSALAASVGFLLLMRFLTGVGLGGELPVATAFVLESSPAAVRGRRTALLETFWAVGTLCAALIGYFLIPVFSWRAAFAVTLLPAFYALYLRRTLPETPAFRGLTERLGFRENLSRLWEHGFRRRTTVLWVLWFSANFAYYGMFLWLPSVLELNGFSMLKSFGFVLIMAVAQIPGYLAAAWLVEKIGRKPTLILFSAASALSALAFGLSTQSQFLLIFGILLNFANLGAWGATYVFSVEQYPAATRGTGLGWAMAAGKIGGMIAPYLVGLLVAAHVAFGGIFTMFFAVTAAGLAVLIAFGKESSRQGEESGPSAFTAPSA